MKPAGAHSTGLTIEGEGKEVPLNELPPWTEDKIKVLPVVSLVCALLPSLFQPDLKLTVTTV
jgi:hypothetical protein